MKHKSVSLTRREDYPGWVHRVRYCKRQRERDGERENGVDVGREGSFVVT
jgi:hypothetical protein